MLRTGKQRKEEVITGRGDLGEAPFWQAEKDFPLTHQSLLSFAVTTIFSPSLKPSSSGLSGTQLYRATTTEAGTGGGVQGG